MAVGRHGGHDGLCESCRRGDFVTCKNAQIPGISYDGGYADYMIAPIESLVSIPEQLSAIEAAPLMCAGIPRYNALRNSGARLGDIVGILVSFVLVTPISTTLTMFARWKSFSCR